MPSDSFTIYTATRKVMFEVRADRVASSISFVLPISKERSSRRWEFFEFNRDAVLAVSDRVRWEVSLHEAEGTVVVHSADDIARAVPAFDPLTKLLGGSAGGKRPVPRKSCRHMTGATESLELAASDAQCTGKIDDMGSRGRPRFSANMTEMT